MISSLEELKTRYPGAHIWAFGDSAEMANDLSQLVIAGQKTATCSTLESHLQLEDKVTVGDFHIVLNGNGAPACVIRTTSLKIIRFNEVTESMAALEGEGDKSLSWWRKEHQAFFTRGGSFSDEMELVFEEFQLLAF
ncbi:ASCH domain-containing protein [Kosakonia sp. BYX6]|uniref:ASCH domain-containing protein n=1 Tax=Kosakonia calanthes TaxID=3139408 RepID=A0ABZ3B079_9ENTR